MSVNNGGTGAGIRRLIRAAEPLPSLATVARGELCWGLVLLAVLGVTSVALCLTSNSATGSVVLSLSSFAALVLRHYWTHSNCES